MFRATLYRHMARIHDENYDSFLSDPSTSEDRYRIAKADSEEWQIFTYNNFHHPTTSSPIASKKLRNERL